MKVKVTDPAGKECYVPEHWLTHPVLGQGLTLVKNSKAAPKKAAATRKVKEKM